MSDPIIKVLDTTIGETGETQTRNFHNIKRDLPIRFSASIASGDTVVLEGKLQSADDFEVMAEFTDDTPQDVYLMRYWRARRTVDGGVGDSWIKAQNILNETITEHE